MSPHPIPDTTAVLFSQIVRRIMAGDCVIPDLIAAAEQFSALHEKALVSQIYQLWIDRNPADPLLYAMHFNHGTILNEAGDRAGAKRAFQAAMALRPDFLPPYINLGTLLEREGNVPEAITNWLHVANHLAPVNADSIYHRTTAFKQIGRVLEAARQPFAAEDMLRQCLEIDPRQRDVMQHWIALRQVQCAWPLIVAGRNVTADALLGAISPLSLAAYRDDPIFQLANAHRYYTHDVAPVQSAATVLGQWPPPGSARSGILRVGYVSSDLRAHAVGFLTSDVFGLHDRARVEVFSYYCGPPADDETHTRIKQGVDHWRDITTMTDKQAAQRIISDGIDILIDLNGYTKDARTKLFALRPAPIIVSWLGYPGTTGSPNHHYIIADDMIIPPDKEIYYSERVLRLPCYQPNDRHRAIASVPPTRADMGLPEDTFVYCCFNGTQKITQATYQSWMAILRAVPRSVLWLLSGGAGIDDRLRAYAVTQGIQGDRIVFSPFLTNAVHLARYRCADLFLDTAPYGAHTTASDALWMGVPVVTIAGDSFPARVCASLVRSAGLPGLVCPDRAAYEATAIALALDPEQLAAARHHLALARDDCALFDLPGLVRALESLFADMWDDYVAGVLPRPDLTNLALYHDIARSLDHACAEPPNDQAYVTALACLDANAPIPQDTRFWPHSRPETARA